MGRPQKEDEYRELRWENNINDSTYHYRISRGMDRLKAATLPAYGRAIIVYGKQFTNAAHALNYYGIERITLFRLRNKYGRLPVGDLIEYHLFEKESNMGIINKPISIQLTGKQTYRSLAQALMDNNIEPRTYYNAKLKNITASPREIVEDILVKRATKKATKAMRESNGISAAIYSKRVRRGWSKLKAASVPVAGGTHA